MRQPSRVLLVDDKEAVRESLQLALFDFDCTFAQTSSGIEALEMVRDDAFDVIFLDIKLPDIDGIEVLRRFNAIRPDLGKVIILTALPDLKTEAEAMTLGAFRYLQKPLEYDEIRNVFTEATADTFHIVPTSVVSSVVRPLEATQVPTPSAAGAFSRLIVLDDSEDWLDQIQEILEPEFEVMRTPDDVDACRWATSDNFDLAVVDMTLRHGVTGLDVVSRMRMAHPNLRAVVLGDYADYTFPPNSRGALAYVSKEHLRSLPGIIKRVLVAKTRRVFLSYDRVDRERVVELYNTLMIHGLLPWLDFKSITPGLKWEVEIRRAIAECDFFVFCQSKTSSLKEGTIRKEVVQALEKQSGLREDTVYIITARLESCDVFPPLRDFQFVDLFEAGGIVSLLAALSSRK